MAAIENKELLERITRLGERAAMGSEIEIVEIQLKGAGQARLLRVYIDKPGGVTHGDCESISEHLGQLLDNEDAALLDGHYTLEVSSPGIERKLSKPRDFERVIGQKIRLAVQPPGQSRQSLEGRLAHFANGELEVEVGPGNLVHIPLETVQKANLKFEW
jgi:ribosome maturation factor RimP